jgi:hypothetical protein
MDRVTDILDQAKKVFEKAVEAEAHNRSEAEEDVRFAKMGLQWPENIRRERENDNRPCLTVNRLPAFINQVVNDARQNQPRINVHPVDSTADPDTALVMTGLIRNIEETSNAEIAYDTALDAAVTSGFGYFRVDVEFAPGNSFEKDIKINRILNQFSVYGDPYSDAADSSDWNHAFVTTLLPKEDFQEAYPDSEAVNWEASGYQDVTAPWIENDEVRLLEYWHRKEIQKTILLVEAPTGKRQVVTAEAYEVGKAAFDAMQARVVDSREIPAYQVTQYIMTGVEVLETTQWSGHYIPIIPVYGDEVFIDGKRHLLSLIRQARDPQRMFNYWRTVATELVALQPKTPYVGAKGAFNTDPGWETANTDNHPYLEYDPVEGQPPPERQPMAGMPVGALQEATNAADDIKSVIGLHGEGLGEDMPQMSGVAIGMRQQESDTSSFHFIDNLSRAIECAGRVIVDLIPSVYGGERIIRILGEDNEPANVPLNQPVQMPDGATRIYDLNLGQYDLTVTAGPSFTTQRREAAAQMTQLMQAMPQAAPLISDLVAKNLDWPGADEISRRLKTLLPQHLQLDDPQIAPVVAMLQGQLQQQGQAIQQAQVIIGQLKQALADKQRELDIKQQDSNTKTAAVQIDGYEAQTDRMELELKAAGERVQAAQSALENGQLPEATIDLAPIMEELMSLKTMVSGAGPTVSKSRATKAEDGTWVLESVDESIEGELVSSKRARAVKTEQGDWIMEAIEE